MKTKIFTLVLSVFICSLAMSQGKVTYSGYVWNEVNQISNWNFTTDLTDWDGGWVDGSLSGQVSPVVQDGVCIMVPALAPDGNSWHYSIMQEPLSLEPDIPYTLIIKSWASGDSPCKLRFQDSMNGWNTLCGTSSDSKATDGTSEWIYNVNTTPSWYTFHVVFDKLVSESIPRIQWELSLSNNTIYLDSVLLVKDEYITANEQLRVNSSMNVYPNPIGSANQLNVRLAAANIKVSIYNAIGQKIIEKVATGNIAKFDVSSLRKGIYVVRLSDGTSQKFLK